MLAIALSMQRGCRRLCIMLYLLARAILVSLIVTYQMLIADRSVTNLNRSQHAFLRDDERSQQLEGILSLSQS